MRTIDQDFKNAIAEEFYDKVAYFCTKSVDTTARGQKIETAIKGSTSFDCNISFPTRKQISEKYGFKDDVEATLSCDSDTALSEGDIFSYEDVFYKILEMKVTDSHKLIGARKWLSKSSISISA